MTRQFQVNKEEKGIRLDAYLAKISGCTRSKIEHLIKEGLVRIENVSVIKPAYTLKGIEVIEIEETKESAVGLIPQPIELDVKYEDAHLIVIDKKPDMVMYPAAGHESGTLMNAIAYRINRPLNTCGAPLRPGIVHRIDKDTSGLVVVAFDDPSYYSLVEQFKERAVNRKYIAIVYGLLKEKYGEISMPIGRAEGDRKKMSIKTKRGKPAKTSWQLINHLEGASLVEVKLSTGRTHQIRVHFSALGHPVLGDSTYGKKTSVLDRKKNKFTINRQMLHAKTLGFIHPIHKTWLEFESPIPDDMVEVVNRLEKI